MAKITIDIVAEATGSNDDVRALAEKLDAIGKAFTAAAGGEWRGGGVQIALDPESAKPAATVPAPAKAEVSKPAPAEAKPKGKSK